MDMVMGMMMTAFYSLIWDFDASKVLAYTESIIKLSIPLYGIKLVKRKVNPEVHQELLSIPLYGIAFFISLGVLLLEEAIHLSIPLYGIRVGHGVRT